MYAFDFFSIYIMYHTLKKLKDFDTTAININFFGFSSAR